MKLKLGKAIHRDPMQEMSPNFGKLGAGSWWLTVIHEREVIIMAIAKGWVMCRRPKCAPYCAPAKEFVQP